MCAGDVSRAACAGQHGPGWVCAQGTRAMQAVMCVQGTRVRGCASRRCCGMCQMCVCRGHTGCAGAVPCARGCAGRRPVLECAGGDGQLLTFEHGADPPDAEATLTGELPEGELHEEEGDAAKHQHDEVGEHEGTWRAGTRR